MTVSRIKELVGEKGWIDGSADTEKFVTEWRDRYRGKALMVVAPASTEEVAAVVRLCAEEGTPIVPQGGNTGLCGGAIPDDSGMQIVLSLGRMNKIRGIDASNYSMTVDAGCTLSQIQDVARREGRFFPLSLSSEGSCQIGGNLSTNAGGINVLSFGTARAQVLGLEVVLPNGKVIDGLRALRKDTAGYDLKQLFIGAEGTLGVITGACLKLQPKPGPLYSGLLAIDSADASVTLLSRLRHSLRDSLHAFELFPDIAMQFVTRHIPGTPNPFQTAPPWQVLFTSDAAPDDIESVLAECLTDGLIQDAVIAKNDAESEALWRIRHSISAAQKPEGISLKHDVSVPVARIGEFIQMATALAHGVCPDARVVAFGHVGDGNVHFNVSQPVNGDPDAFAGLQTEMAHAIYDLVAEFGGSFSAEHGIGQTRRPYLARYRSEAELETMRAIKAALDPQGIMNPGKVL